MGIAGGIANGIKEREIALQKYYENPNFCLYCNKIILVPDNRKVSEVRIKKFCNHSCSAQYHANIQKIKTQEKKLLEQEKRQQEEVLSEKPSSVSIRTKQELFTNSKNWQCARSIIQRLARKVYENSEKPKKCIHCGYDKHYEVCHIKPVSEFEDNATILNINQIANLIALCPNCHWEFDNGCLTIEEIMT